MTIRIVIVVVIIVNVIITVSIIIIVIVAIIIVIIILIIMIITNMLNIGFTILLRERILKNVLLAKGDDIKNERGIFLITPAVTAHCGHLEFYIIRKLSSG